MPLWLIKVIVYGNLGILVEHHFTGLFSLFQKHWKLTTCSYLFMGPVYGLTAILLEWVGDRLSFPNYISAFIFALIIYCSELVSGLAIKKSTKYLEKWFGGTGGDRIPWEYPKSKWSPFGAINLKYFMLWYGLSLIFCYTNGYVHKALKIVGTIGG